jgi:RecA-family ATPase
MKIPHLRDASAAPAPTNLDYALAYARRGWAVLPVWSVDPEGQCRCGRHNSEKGHKAGKHPHSGLVPNGHLDATTDEQVIRDWYATDPEAGIGLNLSQSGLLALDIDPKNGGWESLAAIEAEHGVLHSDCTALTQGAGEHRLFTADPALAFPGKLGPGLDLKHHGYICVAPTLGPSGEYKWAAGRSPLSKSNPAAPSALPELIASKGRAPTSYSLTERAGAPVATAQTFDDLRSALEHVDADDYETWVNVGMVLKPYGENGYKVWTEWSERSDKFDAAAQRRKWERDIDRPHSITYRSIFRMALDNGWSGSAKAVTVQKEQRKSLEEFVLNPITIEELRDSKLNPRVILPFMLYADVRTRISAGGTGKTTVALYEAVILALGRELWGRTPEREVRTVIVTREDTREILVARAREIMKALGLDAEAVHTVLRNLLILDLSGESFRISRVEGDVVEPHVDNLNWIKGLLKDFAPDWMIMDPLVSFGVGEQRVNDAEQGLIEAMRILRAEFDCCVEGIHHSGKANAREKTLDQYSGRGGSALADGARMVCVMQPLTAQEWAEATGGWLEDGESGLVMAMPKMSYCRAQEPVYLKRRGYLFEQVTPAAQPSATELQAEVEATVYLALKDAWLRNQPLSLQDLKNDYKTIFYGNLKRDAIMEAVGRLKRDGRVLQHANSGGRGSRAVLEPVIFDEAAASKFAVPYEPKQPGEPPG